MRGVKALEIFGFYRYNVVFFDPFCSVFGLFLDSFWTLFDPPFPPRNSHPSHVQSG